MSTSPPSCVGSAMGGITTLREHPASFGNAGSPHGALRAHYGCGAKTCRFEISNKRAQCSRLVADRFLNAHVLWGKHLPSATSTAWRCVCFSIYRKATRQPRWTWAESSPVELNRIYRSELSLRWIWVNAYTSLYSSTVYEYSRCHKRRIQPTLATDTIRHRTKTAQRALKWMGVR